MYITLNGNELKSLKNTISKKRRLPKLFQEKKRKKGKLTDF